MTASQATVEEQLPRGGGRLWRHGDDFYVEDGFVAFACERQGYVEEMIR